MSSFPQELIQKKISTKEVMYGLWSSTHFSPDVTRCRSAIITCLLVSDHWILSYFLPHRSHDTPIVDYHHSIHTYTITAVIRQMHCWKKLLLTVVLFFPSGKGKLFNNIPVNYRLYFFCIYRISNLWENICRVDGRKYIRLHFNIHILHILIV